MKNFFLNARILIIFSLIHLFALPCFSNISNQITVEQMSSSKSQTLALEKQSGKSIVIFWASWCYFCQKLITFINEEVPKDHLENFEIISISIDKDKEKMKAFAKAHFTKAKHFWFNANANPHFKPGTIPFVLIYDKDGQLDTAMNGTSLEVKKMIKRRLNFIKNSTLRDEDLL